MTGLSRIIRGALTLYRWGVIGWISLLFALTLAEIASRFALGTSIPFALEYTSYLVALSLTWGLGPALHEGAHIRITILTGGMGYAYQARLARLTDALGLLISALLFTGLTRWAWGSYVAGARSFFPSETPLAIPQALVAAGAMGLVLAFILRLLEPRQGETE